MFVLGLGCVAHVLLTVEFHVNMLQIGHTCKSAKIKMIPLHCGFLCLDVCLIPSLL